MNNASKHAILFVCLGNICRSPMAECVFRDMVERHGAQDRFEVDSAGILSYHQGEQPDRRMREMAYAHGYRLIHASRPVCYDDYERFDLIIGMDDSNIDALREKAPTLEASERIHRISEFFDPDTPYDHIPDPYYGGTEGFALTLTLLRQACHNLFLHLTQP